MVRLRYLLSGVFLLVMSCSNTTTQNQNHPLNITKITFDSLDFAARLYYQKAAEQQYHQLFKSNNFSGGILLAKNGQIVFEDYHGYVDLKTKDPIGPHTPIHIASTSKTFTGIVILRLMEQNKLKLDDLVETHLAGFPYHNVTIKDLLTHRSGLPNYTHFLDDEPYYFIKKKVKKGKKTKLVKIKKQVDTSLPTLFTNQKLLEYLITHKPAINALPNKRFQYCNTNYAMLALIVEKLTGISFPKYMKDSVFAPLGMQDSYVFSINDTGKYVPSYQPNGSPFRLQKLDCVYGDKNVYTTPRDLLQWDIALYQASIVSTASLEMAFSPYSFERKGEHNYGLGFRLLVRPDETIVYHNGWWHGNNSVFKRLIKDTATVIVMGNRFNRTIYAAGKLSSIFTGAIDTTKTID